MFYDEFVKLCENRNVSRTKACIDCGVSRTAWHKWENGATPSGATINKFAEYFGVSVSQLLSEQKEKPAAESSELDKQLEGVEFALWGEVKELTDAQKRDVLKFARFLKEQAKEE